LWSTSLRASNFSLTVSLATSSGIPAFTMISTCLRKTSCPLGVVGYGQVAPQLLGQEKAGDAHVYAE